MMHKLPLVVLSVVSVLVACSSSEATSPSPTFQPSYHLLSIDGATLPINEASGGSIDSGHVVRQGDTVVVDQFSHVPPSGGNPQIGTINHGLWLASQTGSVIVLSPLIASSQDTAFLSGSDTLTLHTYVSGSLQVALYVAP